MLLISIDLFLGWNGAIFGTKLPEKIGSLWEAVSDRSDVQECVEDTTGRTEYLACLVTKRLHLVFVLSLIERAGQRNFECLL